VKVLAYAGGEYLTGDDIAGALLDYSEALAGVGSAASIDIPILTARGRREAATFLVGPSSQIVATAADVDAEELVDQDVVDRLRALTRALHPVARPVEPDDLDDFDNGI
jgi:hypothetical protein